MEIYDIESDLINEFDNFSNANGNIKSVISASILTNPIITLVSNKINGGLSGSVEELKFIFNMNRINQSDIAQLIINLIKGEISGGVIAAKSQSIFIYQMSKLGKYNIALPIINYIKGQISGGVIAAKSQSIFIYQMSKLTLPNPLIDRSNLMIQQGNNL